MVTDYARKIMSCTSCRNNIFPVFFQNLATFPCFLGLPVPTFSLLFAGKPLEALGWWLTSNLQMWGTSWSLLMKRACSTETTSLWELTCSQHFPTPTFGSLKSLTPTSSRVTWRWMFQQIWSLGLRNLETDVMRHLNLPFLLLLDIDLQRQRSLSQLVCVD